MKNMLFALLLAAGGSAFSQNAPLEGISESTDPEKIREVERRAEEIKSRQQAASSGASDTATGAASSKQRETMRAKSKKMKREPDTQGTGKQ